jgi:hypothetical protein
MSKALDDCVMFANWCRGEKLEPLQGRALILLARKAHSAGERECNYPTGRSADRARNEFARYAVGIWGESLAVEWHGLWPSCTRTDGTEIRIPDLA